MTDYFGKCPQCGGHDGYVNAGRTHVFYCDAHKVSWIFGANVFTVDETEEEQREAYKHIEGYERLSAVN